MGKTKLLLAISMTLNLTIKVFAQNFYEECGLDAAMEELKNNDPDYYNTESELFEFTQKFIQNKAIKQTEAQYIIPVVVHIVHENGPENIPSENILDMLRIVNEDYQHRQADTVQAVPPFNAIIGKLDIEFRLATKDPNGNCTNELPEFTIQYFPIVVREQDQSYGHKTNTLTFGLSKILEPVIQRLILTILQIITQTTASHASTMEWEAATGK